MMSCCLDNLQFFFNFYKFYHGVMFTICFCEHHVRTKRYVRRDYLTHDFGYVINRYTHFVSSIVSKFILFAKTVDNIN